MDVTPNFFIVGAPKAGTTALYHYLDQHNAVYMSPIKEPNLFAPEVAATTRAAGQIILADGAAAQAHLDTAIREKRARSVVSEWEDYLALFRNVRNETAVGEASVAYLGSLGAPGAIRARIPHARIVMMLRDPADRLFSYYAALQFSGKTKTSFARWAAELAGTEVARCTSSGMMWSGRYAMHLRRYLEHFPPAQIRVELYDDFVRAPQSVLHDLLAFLDVDPDVPLDLRRRHNVTLVRRWPAGRGKMIQAIKQAIRAVVPAHVVERARSWYVAPRPAAPAAERAQVIEMYEQDIRDLETLLQRDLSVWLDPKRSALRDSARL